MLSFLAIADWGGQEDWPLTTDAQLACATAMGTVARQLNSQFVLSAGDNFYETARSLLTVGLHAHRRVRAWVERRAYPYAAHRGKRR